VTLDFLDAARTYTAHVYRDGDDASWQSRPHSIAIETRNVKRGDSLVLKLAPGGGQAIRFQARK
jgi:alpha-glucosidase